MNKIYEYKNELRPRVASDEAGTYGECLITPATFLSQVFRSLGASEVVLPARLKIKKDEEKSFPVPTGADISIADIQNVVGSRPGEWQFSLAAYARDRAYQSGGYWKRSAVHISRVFGIALDLDCGRSPFNPDLKGKEGELLTQEEAFVLFMRLVDNGDLPCPTHWVWGKRGCYPVWALSSPVEYEPAQASWAHLGAVLQSRAACVAADEEALGWVAQPIRLPGSMDGRIVVSRILRNGMGTPALTWEEIEESLWRSPKPSDPSRVDPDFRSDQMERWIEAMSLRSLQLPMKRFRSGTRQRKPEGSNQMCAWRIARLNELKAIVEHRRSTGRPLHMRRSFLIEEVTKLARSIHHIKENFGEADAEDHLDVINQINRALPEPYTPDQLKRLVRATKTEIFKKGTRIALELVVSEEEVELLALTQIIPASTKAERIIVKLETENRNRADKLARKQEMEDRIRELLQEGTPSTVISSLLGVTRHRIKLTRDQLAIEGIQVSQRRLSPGPRNRSPK